MHDLASSYKISESLFVTAVEVGVKYIHCENVLGSVSNALLISFASSAVWEGFFFIS